MKKILCVLVLAIFTLSSSVFAEDALKLYRTGRDMEQKGLTENANTYYSDAVTVCKNELQLNDKNIESYVVMCWALFRLKKYNEVVDNSVKALKINPNEYRIIENLGETYFYLDRYSESLRNLERYVDAIPNGDRTATAYFFMGEIYRIEGKNHHADIAYSHAVKKEGTIALWWYRLGIAREKAGSIERAKEAYRKALALRPAYKEAEQALNRLG
ncbi:MAG: tetratricopeptide repeat protein [Spirochaetaceae bacterium]|nr:tetratricopeptide repeat protein [Spirochaetaceae bacterium]MDD6487099.1 tetratricopeptide repeat protein [Spirochaetales bacterium]